MSTSAVSVSLGELNPRWLVENSYSFGSVVQASQPYVVVLKDIIKWHTACNNSLEICGSKTDALAWSVLAWFVVCVPMNSMQELGAAMSLANHCVIPEENTVCAAF